MISNQSVRQLIFSRALRIISERSTKGDTRDLLLEELASRNKVQQRRALNALNFLVSNRARMPPNPLYFYITWLFILFCSHSNLDLLSTR